jgi:hypothetical protein
VLAGDVRPEDGRSRHQPAHRRHVDDHPGALGSHGRQDGAQQAHRTEEVGLEGRAHPLVGQQLDRPEVHDAGVIDEDVDAAVVEAGIQ